MNLASRIEQLNKSFGSQLLISDRVWQTLAEIAPSAIPIGDVHVKGREGAIQIHQGGVTVGQAREGPGGVQSSTLCVIFAFLAPFAVNCFKGS